MKLHFSSRDKARAFIRNNKAHKADNKAMQLIDNGKDSLKRWSVELWNVMPSGKQVSKAGLVAAYIQH